MRRFVSRAGTWQRLIPPPFNLILVVSAVLVGGVSHGLAGLLLFGGAALSVVTLWGVAKFALNRLVPRKARRW